MVESVVKVSITENQTRITIPKALAINSQLITRDGKPGKYTHVVVRGDRGKSLLVYPIEMDIS